MAQQAVRFIVVGVVATLIHWGIYTLLKELFSLSETDDWGISVAYSVGYAVSLLVNYMLSLRYTFHTQGNFGKWLGFVFSHVVNYVMHIALLNLFLWMGIGQQLAQLFRMLIPELPEIMPLLGDPLVLLPLPVFFIVVPINFLLVRFFLLRGKTFQ